jgi:hypothetical protein
MKLHTIIISILFLAMIVCIWTYPFDIETDYHAKCYDNLGHEIKGLECIDKGLNFPLIERIGLTVFISLMYITMLIWSWNINSIMRGF